MPSGSLLITHRCTPFSACRSCFEGLPSGTCTSRRRQEGTEFTSEDEELVTLLASQAAVAIENARLYEAATSWSRQLESLHEVVRSLVEESDLDVMLELICSRLRELLDARIVQIALPEGDDELRIASVDAEGELAAGLIGHREALGRDKAGRVFQRGHSARVDSILEDTEVDQDQARRFGIRVRLCTSR